MDAELKRKLTQVLKAEDVNGMRFAQLNPRMDAMEKKMEDLSEAVAALEQRIRTVEWFHIGGMLQMDKQMKSMEAFLLPVFLVFDWQNQWVVYRSLLGRERQKNKFCFFASS